MGVFAEIFLILSILWNIFKFIFILLLLLPFRFFVLFFNFLFSFRNIVAILVLVLFSILIAEYHDDVVNEINKVYCESADVRKIISSITILLSKDADKLICLWNLIWTVLLSWITAFFNLTVSCDLTENFLIDSVFLVEGIITSFFEFISDIGSADFNILSIWTDVQNLLGTLVDFFGCSCNDLAIFLEKFINMLRSDGIGIALHHYVNFLVKLIQSILKFSFNVDQSIDFVFIFDYLCDGTKGLGIFFDDVQRIFFSFFIEDPLDNGDDHITGLELNIGCMLSRIICLAIESIAILIQTIWNIIFVNNTTEIDLSSVFLTISELSACLRKTLMLFDDCLADVVYHLIELIKEIGLIIVVLFKDPSTVDFTDLFEKYIHFIGKDQYAPSETHLSPADSTIHKNPINQTSLACLIGRLFTIQVGPKACKFDSLSAPIIFCGTSSECDFGTCSNNNVTTNPNPNQCEGLGGFVCSIDPDCKGECKHIVDTECTAKAVADLTINLVNYLSLPIYIIDKMTEFNGTGYIPENNPFDGTNLDITNEFISIIICEIIDRILILLDNIGHLFQCAPIEGIRLLGDVIIDLLAILDDVLIEIKILLVTLIELIIQFFVLIFSVFGGSPFSESFGEEFIIFFELLGDLIIEILDILLDLLEFIVNLILFPWFPAIFGQNTLNQDNPGTATFTECMGDLGNCICGITKQISRKVCLPLDIGCLSELWPNCGDFNKRSQTTIEYGDWPNSTVFEYWANTFNTSICSTIFNRWKDGPPSEKVSEFELLQYLSCIGLVFQNLKTVNNSNISVFENHDHFINTNKIKSTANQTIKGMEVMMAYEFVDLLNNIRNPDSYDVYAGTKKINDINNTISYSEKSNNRNLVDFSNMLRSRNITDQFALENIKSSKVKLDDFKNFYLQKPRITKKNTMLYNIYNISIDSIYIFSRIAHGINEKEIFSRLWDSFGKISEGVIDTKNNDRRKRNEEIIINIDSIDNTKIIYNRTSLKVNKQKHTFTIYNVNHGYVKQLVSNDYLKDQCIEFMYDCSTPNIDNCNQMAKLKANNIENCYPYLGYSIQVNCENNFQIVHVFNDSYCSSYIKHYISYGTEEFCFEFGSDFICMYGNLCKPCYNIELQIFENLNCSYFTEIANLVSNATMNCLKKFDLIGRDDVVFNDTIHTTITNFTIPIGNGTRIGTKCGNNFTDPGEQCDDGNRLNGDGCTNLCFLERCGNSINQVGETCDDGNRVNDDGCDSNCQFEIGCGDGIIERAEQCDDGNLNNGDGCNDLCQLEACGVFTLNSINSNDDICSTNIMTLSSPQEEFNVNGKSFHMNCFADIPVVSIHDDINGFGNIIESIKIDSTCGIQKGFCFDNPILNGVCEQFVSFGSDFSCSINCSVCGDRIINTDIGEECDDGHLQGGGPGNCVRCQKACECSPDDRDVCFGTCIGGHNDGQMCNPRLDNRNNIPNTNITFNKKFFNNKGLIFIDDNNELFGRCASGCSNPSITNFDGTDISISNRRWVAKATSLPNDSVFLIADNGKYLTRCPQCDPSTGCGPVAYVLHSDPNLIEDAAWIIENIEPIGSNLVTIRNVQNGKYIRKHDSNNKIGCIDVIDPINAPTAQFVIEIVGVGEECSDGGGICAPRSCCGDGIIQNVVFEWEEIPPTIIPQLQFAQYSETCENVNDTSCIICRENIAGCDCDRELKDVSQFPITETITTDQMIKSYHPCLGRCYLGKYDGKKCLAYPSDYDEFINNFGVNESVLIQELIRVNCSGTTDGLPDSGTCIPTLCCNQQPPFFTLFEAFNFIPLTENEHKPKGCDDGTVIDLEYRDFFPKQQCPIDVPPLPAPQPSPIDGGFCEWDCCLFDGITPTNNENFKRKRNNDEINIVKFNDIYNDNYKYQQKEDNDEKELRILYSKLNNSPSKVNFLKDFIYSIFEAIGGLFVEEGEIFDIEQWFVDNILGFITNTNTDPDASLDEVGLIWYINFLLTCDINRNLCCQRGIGFWPAIGIFILVVIVLALINSLCFNIFTICTTLVFILIAIIGISIAGFFYSPICFPRIPECLVAEILSPFNHLKNQSLPWPHGSVIKNNNLTDKFIIEEHTVNCSACNLLAVDCKQVGFTDGFDNLVYILEVFAPDFMKSFRQTHWFSFFNMFEIIQIAFDRFNYEGSEPPDVDSYCNDITILNIFQVIFVIPVMIIFYILLVVLFKLISIIFVIFNRIIKYTIIKDGEKRDEILDDIIETLKINDMDLKPFIEFAKRQNLSEFKSWKDSISLKTKINNKISYFFGRKKKKE